MHTHEAIFCQRVNSPIIVKNLDATKVTTRPPSRALSNLVKKPVTSGDPRDPFSSLSNDLNRLTINGLDTHEVLSANDGQKGVAGYSYSSSRNNDRAKTRTVDVLNRESFFCGNIDTVNERLVDLANIGRCDLYKKKEPKVYNNLEELQDSLIFFQEADKIRKRRSDTDSGRACFLGACNPYLDKKEKMNTNTNRNTLFHGPRGSGNNEARDNTVTSAGPGHVRKTIRLDQANQSSGRDTLGVLNSKKSANQDLKMLALMVTPELSKITNGDAEIPFGLNLKEIISKLDDIEGLTYLNYCKKQLIKSKALIIDIFWYIFLEKFYRNTKNRNLYSKSEILNCQEKLILKISEKFVDLLVKSEHRPDDSKHHVSSFSINRNTFMTPRHVQFFRQLPTILSLTVYSTFCHCWKDSWNSFVDPEFRQYIIDTLSLWIEGIRHIPGKGEEDAFWRRVEPFLLRQDKSRTDKSTSVKTVAEHLSSTLGVATSTTNCNRWGKGFAKVSLMNRLGGNLNKRRHTVKRTEMSVIKKNITNKETRAMQFESSKFNINGRSPLFSLHVDRNYGPSIGHGKSNEEHLVSRRSCVEKKFWKENPLKNAHDGLKRAKAHGNKAKAFYGR